MSTLPYEALGFTMRLKLYERLKTYENLNMAACGFISGAVVEGLLNPLFKLNLANHNHKLSDLTMKEFLT